VTTFADQAVIAIENVRLFDEVQARTAELSEALEQQTATSEVLRVISSSPGNLEPVFQAMLANATRICEANFGVLFRFKGGAVEAAAMVGVPPAFAEFWQRGAQRPGPRTALGRIVETKQTVHIIRADFDVLGRLANRYGVSLTATILRWLEYTETRAMMVVSNERFAHWAKSSKAAFRSGRFIRTKDAVFELPQQAFAARGDYSDAALTGTMQSAGVWFPEPVFEMCFRSDRYDQEITLLHFESEAPRYYKEEEIVDVFERFVQSGQTRTRLSD
jgi:hypothetical protein